MVLEFAPPEPEEQQWEPPQGEGAEEDLPECPDHRPSTYNEGKPRSIIFVIMSSCQLTIVMYCCIKCQALI